MATDEEEIVGKWKVSFHGTKGAWKWEYTFSANKKVTWRDPLNGINGSGTWAKQGKLININWFPSTTKESWYGNSIKPAGQKGYIDASYGVGEFSAEKIVDKPASDDRDLNKYIDNFNWCKYDVNYKVPSNLSFEFSYILQLKFPDAVVMDFDYRMLEDRVLDDRAWRAAMDQAYMGSSGRLYPRVMAAATVPRLWKHRLAAIEMRDEASLDFFLTAHAGLAAVLSVPAMPVGPMSEATFAGVKSTKTRTQGLTREVVPSPMTATIRPRATPAQLRQMVNNPENTYVWATHPNDAEIVKNQRVSFTGKTNPEAVEKVHLLRGKDGITGHKYGEYKVAIDGNKNLVRASQHAPGEYFVDEIPGSQGVWFNDEDLAGIGALPGKKQ